MKTIIIDTETAGNFSTPFIYNIGYVIADLETGEVLAEKEFIVEQVWHNQMLMASCYFSNKKPTYLKGLKGRTIELDKFGYILRKIDRDIKKYNIEKVYAYNSNFDEKAFKFNCEWFKCINPFETIPFYDIRKLFLISSLNDDRFKNFCKNNNFLTKTGKSSTTAETVYNYISERTDFIESHTALDDSRIEYEILKTIFNTAEKD